MFNLYEIVQNAQDGQAIDNLAKQFNISPQQTDAAVQALLPAISSAFMKRTAEPAAFGSILGAMGEAQHAAAFSDPSFASSDETREKGAEVAQHLFGSAQTNAAVAQHAASLAGLPPSLIQQMIPVILSMLMGGISKSMANQGLGGVLGQLAGASGQGGIGAILGSLLGGAGTAQAQPQGAGGLGSILGNLLGGGAQPRSAPTANPGAAGGGQDGLGGLGSILGGLLGGAGPAQARPPVAPQASPAGPAPAAPDAAGGPGGILGSILGSLLGGAPGAAQPQGRTAPQPGQGGIDPAAVQTSLDALIKMLQPGTPPPPGQKAGLQSEIDSILDGKRS